MRGLGATGIIEVNFGRGWSRRGLWQAAAGQNTTVDLKVGVSLGNVEMGGRGLGATGITEVNFGRGWLHRAFQAQSGEDLHHLGPAGG